jgi:fluoride exporter
MVAQDGGEMLVYLWVAIGSALGGVLRYAVTRLMVEQSAQFPWSTVFINVAGSFVIGFFGTLTLSGGRYGVSENTRMFVMVGICGGFTTFSSFSVQTFDLMRSGAWVRAVLNVVLSVVICLFAVALGHYIAERMTGNVAIAQTDDEELTG